MVDLLAKEREKRLLDNTRILEVSLVFFNDVLWVDILGTTFIRKTLVCDITITVINNIVQLDSSAVAPAM